MNEKPQWVEMKSTVLEHNLSELTSRWSHDPERTFDIESICEETLRLQRMGWRANPPKTLWEKGNFEHAGVWISEAVLVSMQQYVQATKAIVGDYKAGADSGDWGFWEFEDEPEVIAYREAEKNLDSILNP